MILMFALCRSKELWTLNSVSDQSHSQHAQYIQTQLQQLKQTYTRLLYEY